MSTLFNFRRESVAAFLTGIILGSAIGFGGAYYCYVYHPIKEEISRSALCGKGSMAIANAGQGRLGGTELHKFIIANQDLISNKVRQIFFINGKYRSLDSSESPYKIYLLSGSSVCVFDGDSKSSPTFRTVHIRGKRYYFNIYSNSGVLIRSINLSF
jgi:hypothetical protein